jgi:uncharacterized protein
VTTPDPVDYRTPSPDAGHEAIRLALVQAIADLATANAAIDKHTAALDSLTTRVTALEKPLTPVTPTIP